LLTVNQLVEKFNFEVLAGHVGLDKVITKYSLKRPSAELAGYLEHLIPQHIQFYGRTELGLIQQFDDSVRRSKLAQVMLAQVPCVIVTRGLTIPLEFIELASERKIPLLTTPRSTTQLFYLLIRYLINQLAPSASVQGVLVDVYGVGVMITGERGTGKSEATLELIKSGHLLVAADVVKVRRVDEERLLGTAQKKIRHQLEVRGLGILDVMTLFGAGSVRDEKAINFIVHLEEWQHDKIYDRIGIDPPKTRELLGILVPEISIPVRPGRNLATLIEVAVIQNWNRNCRWQATHPFRDM